MSMLSVIYGIFLFCESIYFCIYNINTNKQNEGDVNACMHIHVNNLIHTIVHWHI